MPRTGFSAPHYLASQTGNEILSQGGSAVDAMVAAAATIAVVYPHMNSLGGDGFWLIQRQGQSPVAIDACGRSANSASALHHQDGMPSRGEAACITQAGAVSGWQLAREYLSSWRTPMPLATLFADAINYAKTGVGVTDSYVDASHKILKQGAGNQAFKEIYTHQGQPLSAGDIVTNPQLAELLVRLIDNGLADFYQGEVAQTIAEYFSGTQSPLAIVDFAEHRAQLVEPLSVNTSQGNLYNLPAPTQGFASLLILAIYDQLYDASWDTAQQVHHIVEATKQAFQLRDQYLTDPAAMTVSLDHFLTADAIAELSQNISPSTALPWPNVAQPGDTVWMGCVDKEGTMVSYIQSIYWEFGSGIVIPELGLLWNNRGVSFSLDAKHVNYLEPGKKPFHTLNPALAVLSDGSRMAYGTMGGEGQPQTQAAVFNQFQYQKQSLSDAISAPRWLLGRTWGDANHNLKLEQRLMQTVGKALQGLGHSVEGVADLNEMMGHAGAVYLGQDQTVSVAVDPRSDGKRKTP